MQFGAIFEPKGKFETNNEESARNKFFDFTEEVIRLAIDNKTKQVTTIYRNTMLEFSKIIPESVKKKTFLKCPSHYHCPPKTTNTM